MNAISSTHTATNGRHARRQMGQILLQHGRVDERQLAEALDLQKRHRDKLGALLCRLGHLDTEGLDRALRDQAGVPDVDLSSTAPDPKALGLVTAEFALRHKVFPFAVDQRTVSLAMANPFDRDALDAVRVLTGRRVRRFYCAEPTLMDAARRGYGTNVARMIADLDASTAPVGGAEVSERQLTDQLQEMAREPTVVNLVNLILLEAIDAQASDVHVEPFEQVLKVKYRIDGVLHERQAPPKKLQPAIVSRIKIMAGMDIAERFVPQDGHIHFHAPNGRVDVRVATVPTLFGECVVLRLLDRSTGLIDLERIGLSDLCLDRFTRLLGRPHGIILVTGPTGSGKTTTLYGALNRIYTPEKKIITIEDPVEYELEGINQIPVNPKRGLDFANGLRAILRQDPDVIMVGEIRDRETADIAIRSALTGHLVFSTLHTNDAAGAVTRLLDMGIEPFLLASSLEGVLAQRLVRRLCTACKAPYEPDAALRRRIERNAVDTSSASFVHGRGCDRCRQTGYAGRTGIFELLRIETGVREAILHRASAVEIGAAAPADHEPMAADGLRKALAGHTTLDEVLRVTQDAGGSES